uniref:Uncharacterized protein n=1 Tax=Arion vulgaris TaxID=1028688 RepID=A0A0B7AJJ9_9EUPU
MKSQVGAVPSVSKGIPTTEVSAVLSVSEGTHTTEVSAVPSVSEETAATEVNGSKVYTRDNIANINKLKRKCWKMTHNHSKINV